MVAGLTGRAVDRVEDADWVVDDAIDGCPAVRRWASEVGKPLWGLVDCGQEGVPREELVLPWETQSPATSRTEKLERIGFELLEVLGYEPTLEGLCDTPRRWARWWDEFQQFDPGNQDTAFREATIGRMVCMDGISLWSICEHHLLPFSAEVSIGYVPRDQVLGLSKFVRIANGIAHRLQLQERLTAELAAAVSEKAGSSDVAVLVRGRHQCLEARGVRHPAVASTLVTLGAFEADGELRRDFLVLMNRGPGSAGIEGCEIFPDRVES